MIHALALTGPTASGKTELSLCLAEKFDCEIISCDSMQIYEKMDIGTAKATPLERARIPHHLIDFLSPTENYSAENYREDAKRCMEEIQGRGKIPLFVGGTGLYIDTVIRGGTLQSPPSDKELMAKLLDGAKTEEGKNALFERLKEVDPESAEKTHKNNVRRVARALEIFLLTGKTKTSFDEKTKVQNCKNNICLMTLDFNNRDNLYRRVDTRVDLMMKDGLLEETEMLKREGLLLENTTAGQAIGYKEILQFLNGKMTLDEAVEYLKMSSRRYAKRQLTWFRHEENAHRVFLDGQDGVMKDRETVLGELSTICENFLNTVK